MAPKLIFVFLITAGAFFELAGDIVLKYWAISNRGTLMVIGLLVYFIGSIFWAYSLRHETLSRSLIVFSLSYLILGALAGLLYFKETLTPRQLAGVGLALVAIILIEA